MADLVMGAMSSIIPKLYQLLNDEYNLHASVKERIRSLMLELDLAQAALCKVAEVPWDQLDKHVQIWARKVREASYDMEDVLDTFLVRVEGLEYTEEKKRLWKHLKKMTNFFKKSMARRKISGDVKNIMTHLQEVTEQCRRYKVEDIGTRTATTSSVDPRLHAMYTQVNKLVGVDKSSGELISMLQTNPQRGDKSSTKMKIVSIVGVGGLGKTTLAKVVYDKIKGDFDCTAFVPVGRNADLKKILKDILIDLDKRRYLKYSTAALDEKQLIDEFHKFFLENNKRYRYFIVIDDLWEKQSWEVLKLATAYDKSCNGRIIITTRKWEVANNADEVYQLPTLLHDSSRKLFYTRIYGDERKFVDYQPDDVSDEILRKCAGIPLAIITMASLLVQEPKNKWFEVYQSIGFGCKDNEDSESIMKKILSFSYYDLPSHLRACLLYLSAFPEDSVIPKVSLIWMWAAEGFVRKQEGKGFFEIGEGYFNDLINRSLIQEVYEERCIYGCRLHDMVLDFVLSISCEENFFTVYDNSGHGTLVPGNVVRRLAHHNKTTVPSNQVNMFDMSKVRSFISLDEYIVDTWAPFSSFKLLRVLNIGTYYRPATGSVLCVKPLGQLLHMRFLGINKRCIEKIPKEIGALKMLQTLDLWSSLIQEGPSNSSLPTQLLCLRIAVRSFDDSDSLMGRLTFLEELFIDTSGWGKDARRLLKELGNLRELRVLNASIDLTDDEETKRDLLESVHHLYKLQHLKVYCLSPRIFFRRQEMEFVLPGDLRVLALHDIVLWKLPSCIDPLCHRKLSHLDLCLQYMDDHELKTLGGLPELHYLGLDLQGTSATMRNISDSDATYFPKLRSLELRVSLALFVANIGNDGKKTISFHIWDGKVDDSFTKQPSASDSEAQGNNVEFSSVFQWETGRGHLGEKSGEELRLLCVSADGSPVSDEENNGSISNREGEAAGEHAATPRFMPCLQVLGFHVCEEAVQYHPNCCAHLGLEFISSLREISVDIKEPEQLPWLPRSVQVKAVEAALRSAAQVHPNNPTLRIDRW